MPRKLKTYQTSLGFYDLAISAPSMKAALDAWARVATSFIRAPRRRRTTPTPLPRRWRSLAWCLGAPPDRTDASPSIPTCRPARKSNILTRADRRRRSPQARRSARKRSAGPRSISSGSGSSVTQRAGANSLRTPRSASVAIERSPRRRLHSIKPSANMMSEQATSKRSATPSGKGLKTRRLVGRERRGS